MDKENNFIFGAQYYRCPTPERENWANDLKNMRELGMTDVKFWVQWRSNHIGMYAYDFSDIDELMDIALKNDLRVTLNVIFDVAPAWLLKAYPDSLQVTADGTVVEPFAPGHRQLGGFPGVCYNHRNAYEARMNFLRETVLHFMNHPALYMWDIWNEPEQCGKYREPTRDKVTCYCPNCQKRFKEWLKRKYGNIKKLNRAWGKVYRNFDDTELPNDVYTLKDYIDFRKFQSETMTSEANARIQVVKSIDDEHKVYLHVVPDTATIFNAVTGVNDFEMAKQCDVFASTNFASPIWSALTVSAGRGKLCYNAECHIGSGSIRMHQKQIEYKDLVNDFAVQIGMGIRGFMFWQYRPEILGHEAPAWGMTNLDGSIGKVGEAAKLFGERVSTIVGKLQNPKVDTSEIALWKGFDNEVFAFASQVTLNDFGNAFKNYVDMLYNANYSFEIVDDSCIVNGLSGKKVLIMPEPYCIDDELYSAVDRFVRDGGVLICEAHFGGFDNTRGRHSYSMPGFDAQKLWGITEYETTSSYHLKTSIDSSLRTDGFSDDVKKAIAAYGLDGGKFYTIQLKDGSTLTGCNRVAFLKTDGEVLGSVEGKPIIVKNNVGRGCIYYIGSNIGEGADVDMDGFQNFICKILEWSNVEKNFGIDAKGVHVEKICDGIIMVHNNGSDDFVINGAYRSVFYDNIGCNGDKAVIHPGCADIFEEVSEQ